VRCDGTCGRQISQETPLGENTPRPMGQRAVIKDSSVHSSGLNSGAVYGAV
jgi:hypothetical protein